MQPQPLLWLLFAEITNEANMFWVKKGFPRKIPLSFGTAQICNGTKSDEYKLARCDHEKCFGNFLALPVSSSIGRVCLFTSQAHRRIDCMRENSQNEIRMRIAS